MCEKHYLKPWLSSELQTILPSLSSSSLPSLVRVREDVLVHGLCVSVCQRGLLSSLYMTRLPSSCMHRRVAPDFQVFDAHLASQVQVTKLPSCCCEEGRGHSTCSHLHLHFNATTIGLTWKITFQFPFLETRQSPLRSSSPLEMIFLLILILYKYIYIYHI